MNAPTKFEVNAVQNSVAFYLKIKQFISKMHSTLTELLVDRCVNSLQPDNAIWLNCDWIC